MPPRITQSSLQKVARAIRAGSGKAGYAAADKKISTAFAQQLARDALQKAQVKARVGVTQKRLKSVASKTTKRRKKK